MFHGNEFTNNNLVKFNISTFIVIIYHEMNVTSARFHNQWSHLKYTAGITLGDSRGVF